jgi:hypothetical protein
LARFAALRAGVLGVTVGTESAIHPTTGEIRMFKKPRLTALAVLVTAAAATVACGGKSINHVLSDPSRYHDREVTISGRVVDSYSVARQGVYLIEDGTGQLWIASDRGVPRPGARVTVRGTIREAFNIGRLGRNVRLPVNGVLMLERSHRAR